MLFKQSRKGVFGVLAVLFVVAVAYGMFGTKRGATVELTTVTQGNVTLTVPGRARFVPRVSTVLASQEAGTLQRLLKRAGDTVSVGDAIAQIASTTLQAELARTKRERDTALADYETRIAQVAAEDGKMRIEQSRANHVERIAEIQYRAEESLFKRGVSGEIAVEKAKAEYEQKVAEREFADAQLAERTRIGAAERTAALRKREIAEAAAAEAAAKVDALTIKAGFAGILGSMKLKEGAAVAAGAEITTINTPELAIEIDVAEAAVVDVLVGQLVRVSSRGFEVNARIASMEAMAENGVVIVRAEASSPIPDTIRANTSAEARIVTGELAKALTVLRPPGAMPRTPGIAYRVERNGALAKRVRVEFGPLAGDRIVVSQGLLVGDRIALVESFLPTVDL